MGQVNGSKQSATRLAPPTPDPVCFFDSQQQFTTRRYYIMLLLAYKNKIHVKIADLVEST